MTKIDLTKPHLCHICQEEGKFFYKKWWCGHDKHLKGVCGNDKREKGTGKNQEEWKEHKFKYEGYGFMVLYTKTVPNHHDQSGRVY